MAIIIVFIYSDVKTQSELLSKYMKHLRMNNHGNVYLGTIYYYEKSSHNIFLNLAQVGDKRPDTNTSCIGWSVYWQSDMAPYNCFHPFKHIPCSNLGDFQQYKHHYKHVVHMTSELSPLYIR